MADKSAHPFGPRRSHGEKSSRLGTGPPPLVGAPGSPSSLSDYGYLKWAYLWDDGVNPVSDPTVQPHLVDRLVNELEAAIQTGNHIVVAVRGELGIGKSTLRALLHDALSRRADSLSDQSDVRSTLMRVIHVVEAEDLETPVDFAKKINKYAKLRPVVALARPITLDLAQAWLSQPPTPSVTMLPFERGTSLHWECIQHVAAKAGLTEDQRSRLLRLTDSLPLFLQTPFYYVFIADAVKRGWAEQSPGSALQFFRAALDARIGPKTFDSLLGEARRKRFIGQRLSTNVVEGIVNDDGFVHDGYRTVVLAAAMLRDEISVDEVMSLSNSLPSIELLLDHIEFEFKDDGQEKHRPHNLVSELESFASNRDLASTTGGILRIQALVGATLERIGRPLASERIRQHCSELIEGLSQIEHSESVPIMSDLVAKIPTITIDISDALGIVADRRLSFAAERGFGPDSGYFTLVERSNAIVGVDEEPPRLDVAKPLVAYKSQIVEIGPLWVANYLVTYDLYIEFIKDAERHTFFHGTGRAWFNGEPELTNRIAEIFDLSAKRNFWKEIREGKASTDQERPESGVMNLLAIARERALRAHRSTYGQLGTQVEREGARGLPMGSVNWWEALAFCRWWTDRVLPHTNFPSGSIATLLTDWEWEAIRRRFYEGAEGRAKQRFLERLTPAHVRGQASQVNAHRPLHVGLFPVPAGAGPTDMVGNLWEWTRSAVYGSIVPSPSVSSDFGPTSWDNGNPHLEYRAIAKDRDIERDEKDLRYRCVRGSSYFATDPEAAWNASYRLCDPPFASYPDLGFRIAVYAD